MNSWDCGNAIIWNGEVIVLNSSRCDRLFIKSNIDAKTTIPCRHRYERPVASSVNCPYRPAIAVECVSCGPGTRYKATVAQTPIMRLSRPVT